MSIYHNNKEYGATKVINYSASPDYNRGIAVNNIQTGNYQATDNGFLFIQLQSQQSNPTKVSVVRSKTPITDTGTEIASIVLSQYQYSETLTAQVMARDYYKLVIEGVGNPQVISCMFYPYASNVPIKLTEDINIGQVVGLEDELDGKQNAGNYATNTDLTNGLSGKQDKGDYATNTDLTNGLSGKQDKGDYATNTDLTNGLSGKQDKGDYATNTALNNGLATKQNKGNYFNKDTDVALIGIGGTGAKTKEQAQYNLQIKPFERDNYKRLDLNKATNGVLVARMTYLENNPTNLISSGELIIDTVLGQEATTFSDNGPYTYNLQTYRTRSDFSYAQRICAPNGAIGEWKKLRNEDGSIPAGLINLPVGFSYIQASGTNTPDVVFSTTGKWQEITSTATGFPAGTRIWKKIS